MFDTIILLTGPAEHSVFTTLLRGHNPGLTVLPVFTADDLAAIEPEWLGRARLIAFSSSVPVPGAVLDQIGYGAYHFHPGSPQYPGRSPARAALDDGAAEFGGTVHRLVAHADAGSIVDVERFAVPDGASVAGLEEQAYTTLVTMFWRLAGVLANQPAPLVVRAERWGATRNSPVRRVRSPGPLLAGGASSVITLVASEEHGLVPRIGQGLRPRASIPETEPA